MHSHLDDKELGKVRMQWVISGRVPQQHQTQLLMHCIPCARESWQKARVFFCHMPRMCGQVSAT